MDTVVKVKLDTKLDAKLDVNPDAKLDVKIKLVKVKSKIGVKNILIEL